MHQISERTHRKDLVHCEDPLSVLDSLQLVMLADSNLQATVLLSADLSSKYFHHTLLNTG